jgi:hypothetical protein
MHVRVPIGTANINVYIQDSGLPECFAGLARLKTSNIATSEATTLWTPQISQLQFL